MNKVDPKQFLQVEQASIRVPSEQLKKCFRSIQRNIETEKKYFLFAGSELNKANNGQTPKNQLIEMLTKVNNKLSQIDNSLGKMKDEQVHLFSSLKERVNHLKQLDNTPSLDSDEFAKWSRVRLDRLIVDYLLRKGYSTTAQAMVEQERHLEPLVDQDLFKQCRNIEEALAQKDCQPCLAWCTENKTGLKKLQSNLEFNLRIQELVELIRGRKSAEAIAYSKRHLVPNFMNKFQEIQQAISLLAFPPDTTCPPYKQLYDLDRWQGLVKDFRDNLYNLHCLTLIPMLELSLYSGLCSLKCTQCFLERSRNTDCPICDRETFGTLAKPLPYIQHNTSTLVCRINGKVMDDNNPPMALPNGYVYSQKAILDHIQHSPNGKFKCPRSNGEFELSQIRKVFIS